MSRLDVVAIGNALVDVLSHESFEFVTEHELVRDYDAVVFADASREGGEPVTFGEIAPPKKRTSCRRTRSPWKTPAP